MTLTGGFGDVLLAWCCLVVIGLLIGDLLFVVIRVVVGLICCLVLCIVAFVCLGVCFVLGFWDLSSRGFVYGLGFGFCVWF